MPGTFAHSAATNTVTVTGGTGALPADFTSFVAADRAGVGTSLLAAWAPTSNTKALTYQVRPVELLALLITFTVAGKTEETDYIYITGTDAWGTAQTESLDVSAGNGTYVTTKRFRTISNIDCSDNPAGGGTVWADGTVAVTQPIWGVIWNKGGSLYQLDCKWNIGDGATSTFFKAIDTTVVFAPAATASNQTVWKVFANATLQFGNLDDATKKTTKQGCGLVFLENTYYNGNFRSAGTLYLYSCSVKLPYFNGRFSFNPEGSGSVTAWNCFSSGYSRFYGITNGSIYNLICDTATAIDTCSCPIDKASVSATGSADALVAQGGGSFSNVYIRRVGYLINPYNISVPVYLINVDSDNWGIRWGGTCTGRVYRQNSIDCHVNDKDGTNISGASVVLKDAAGTVIFSVATDTGGKIVQQTASRGYYDQAHGSVLQDYGPHTLTITKDGYQDYQDVIILDRKMDLEVALLPAVAAGCGVSPTNLGLVPLGIKQVSI
ncbi:MAG: hypothetical protein WC443_11805 [Desulfobaccales bacterium]